MKNLKASKLIQQKNIASSITISPLENGFEVKYFLHEKGKSGVHKTKTVKVDSIIEDVIIPEISNWTVKHLYKKYQFFKDDNFYINFYKN